MFLSAADEKGKSSSFNLTSSLEKGTSINKNYISEKHGGKEQFLPIRRRVKNDKTRYILAFIFGVVILAFGYLFNYIYNQYNHTEEIKIHKSDIPNHIKAEPQPKTVEEPVINSNQNSKTPATGSTLIEPETGDTRD